VYIVENVVGARQFISLYLGQPAIRIGKRYFWSNLHIDPSEINHAWYERKTLRTVRVIDKHGKMSCAGRGMRGSAKDRSCIERPISEFFYKKCVQEMKKERYDFVPIAIRETEPRCESCNEFLHRKTGGCFVNHPIPNERMMCALNAVKNKKNKNLLQPKTKNNTTKNKKKTKSKNITTLGFQWHHPLLAT
jgi:hypothetical protein